MAGKYPRVGHDYKRYRKPVPNTECDACDGIRVGWVDIQFGWMRGSDDERYFCCEKHYTMLTKKYDGAQQFLRDVEHKESVKQTQTKKGEANDAKAG